MSLLGLDMGTGACKAATFDERGGLLAVASREYSAAIPRPGWMEMDPSEFLRGAMEAIREVVARTPEPVSAIAVSSQGETFVPVDALGRPTHAAIMNADNRARAQVGLFERAVGKRGVYETTGCVLHPMYALLKIAWLRENEPEVFASTFRFLSVGDYILRALGGAEVTDYSLASRTMGFDIRARRWSGVLLEAAGVPESMFPEAVSAGTEVGVVLPEISDVLGLGREVRLAVGGHDQPCGALGVGVVDVGAAADSAGSYECLTVASDAPTTGDEAFAGSVNSYCHVVPDRYVTLAFFPSGIVLRWFRDEFCRAEMEESARTGVDAYDLLASRAPAGPTGICFTPHLLGSGNPTWDANATGAVVGLTPGCTRGALFKAILEGTAMELATNVALLESLGRPIGSLRVTGGGSRSDLWMQLRSDLTGKTAVRMQTGESVCLGAAILAGVGSGVFRDAVDGARASSACGRAFEPDSRSRDAYSLQSARYGRLYRALADGGVY